MQNKDLNEGRVYKIIGKGLGVGFISPEMGPSAIIIFLICLPFIISEAIKGLFIFIFVYFAFWLLVQNDPQSFLERFKKPKNYISNEPSVDFDRGGIPKAESNNKKSSTYKIKGKQVEFQHIEEEFHLRTYGQIELDSRKVGFYLLRRGLEAMFIFCWKVSGYDPSISPKKSESTLKAAVMGLNHLPSDLDIKVIQDINSSSLENSKIQSELLDKDLDSLTREIIKSRGRRGQELAKQGRMQHNDILVYGKYRVSLGTDFAVKQNLMDEFVAKTQPLVGVVKGQKFDNKPAWEKILDSAYHYAYQTLKGILSSEKALGWQVKSLDVEELFEKDYLELHNPPVPKVPQYIVYNEFGLQETVINSHTHSLGTLFAPQDGISVIPKFENSYIYIPNKKKYAAFIRIGAIDSFPEDKQSQHLGHLRYLWNATANTNIGDCRIVSEITRDSSGFEKVQLDRMISNSIKREALAHQKKTIDTVAMERREQAVEARGLLSQNNALFWCSTGFWIYNEQREKLEQNIKKLIREIPTASVERIEFQIEKYWKQTLPFEWEAFLTKPNHRRKKYISFQAISTIPLIKHRKMDRKGMMFLTREINSPVYLNIANKKNHTGIFAKSGAGKSNIILEMLIEYIISDGLVVLFDFPRPDGSSTYTTLIPFLQKLGYKAAYHDVKKSTINVIEMPDLRFVKDPIKRQERWDYAFNSHINFLTTLVIGVVKNADRESMVTSLISQCYYDFHQEPVIKTRYKEAIKGGYGSDEYQKMPILEVFVRFAEQWFISYLNDKSNLVSDVSRQTIDLILIQLNGILKTTLGRAINGISSFDINTSLLVIGLTNVSESLDSLIYAMTGLNALYRAAFSAKRSLLGIDEGTILYKFEFFARETGIIPVHGRKWGCNFLIAAQEIETITNSVSGSQIFKNLDNVFCGNIEFPAIKEMEEIDFDPDIIEQYIKESFIPSKELLQSYWYLKRGDRHLEVTHPPSYLLLALGATEPEEEAAKEKILQMFDDKLEALNFFSEVNKIVKQSDISYEMAITRKMEEYYPCAA